MLFGFEVMAHIKELISKHNYLSKNQLFADRSFPIYSSQTNKSYIFTMSKCSISMFNVYISTTQLCIPNEQ